MINDQQLSGETAEYSLVEIMREHKTILYKLWNNSCRDIAEDGPISVTKFIQVV